MGQDLGGRVALVTGATGGIGAAAARQLVRAGTHVVLAGRHIERLNSLERELGEAATAIPCDVTREDQVSQLFETIGDRFGGIDLLFNCAGIGVSEKFEDSKPDDWSRMVDVNLVAVLRCTHRAIPLMRGREGAMIASVTSVAGLYGVPGWAVYSATKFGVAGFHDALRKELANDRIRVSLIAPGATWTEFGEVPDDRPGEMENRLRQLGALAPEDVAAALLYAFAQPPNVLIETVTVRPIMQTIP